MGGQIGEYARFTEDVELQNYARYCQAVASTCQIGVEPTQGLIDDAIIEWQLIVDARVRAREASKQLRIEAKQEKKKAREERERRKKRRSADVPTPVSEDASPLLIADEQGNLFFSSFFIFALTQLPFIFFLWQCCRLSSKVFLYN